MTLEAVQMRLLVKSLKLEEVSDVLSPKLGLSYVVIISQSADNTMCLESILNFVAIVSLKDVWLATANIPYLHGMKLARL
jgi:hypothetical protein